jgi:uncharacterized membrane protein
MTTKTRDSIRPDRTARVDRAAGVAFGTPYPVTLAGRWRVVLLFALLIAGMLVSLARTPMHVWNILWAEDGSIFVAGALSGSPWTLFEGYAGYMHLVARLGAWLAVIFPLEIVPIAVTIVAAAITSLIACACFLLFEQRIASVPLRFGAWIVCLALPIMGGEVVNNLANLHWYLLIAGFIAVTVRARTTSLLVVQALVLFVAVTSDALALMLIPFVIVRLFLLRGIRERVADLAFVAGAILQIGVVVAQVISGAERTVAPERPSSAEFIDFYTYRVVLGGLFGTSSPARLLEILGNTLPGLALGAVVLVIVAAARADRVRRVGIVVYVLGSVGFAIVVFSIQWSGLAGSPLLEYFTGSRYITVPTALLLLSLLLAADAGLARLATRSAMRVFSGLIVVLLLIPVVIDFRPMNIRSDAAPWEPQIAAARNDCETGPADETVVLAISPAWFGGVVLECPLVEP